MNAEQRFTNATTRVHKCLGLNQGGGAAEYEYSDAFKALVRQGKRLPLKQKYRK